MNQTQYLDNKVCLLTAHNENEYSLNNSNRWSQFPEMKLVFELEHESPVNIFYNITNNSNGATHLCTTVYVDGQENKAFRAISGDTNFHSNSVTCPIILGAGQHVVQVYYRTPGNFQNHAQSDWNITILQVRKL